MKEDMAWQDGVGGEELSMLWGQGPRAGGTGLESSWKAKDRPQVLLEQWGRVRNSTVALMAYMRSAVLLPGLWVQLS